MLGIIWSRYHIAILPAAALPLISASVILIHHFILSAYTLLLGTVLAIGMLARQAWTDEIQARNR
jgi:hypothetical protein